MIGDNITHYRIEKKLGEGGMGEVYLAEDSSLKRHVALKFLPPHMQQNTDALKRFLREAESAASLEHPYICNIKAFSQTDDGRQFIVMEYVEGQTLSEKLKDGPIPVEEVVRIALEICEALELAHDQGIVHRDLKPSNIMLTQQGHAKVMDFGLAKRVLTEGSGEQENTLTALTGEGSTLGTLAYMSPEQLKGSSIDTRSDVFSFGLVLYEMLTGVHPFRRNQPIETASAILTDDPEPLTSYREDIPEQLERMVLKMMSRNPKDRFSSVADVAAQLADPTSAWIGTPTPLASGLQLKVVAACAAAILLVLALGWWDLRQESSGTDSKITSIAVLPLKNLSGDPDQEFFVDGMTEALITDLSKIGALKVIARSSSMRYKGTDKPIDEIARELNVEALVEGSVFREAGQVGITAQLIEVTTGQNLWADRYERSLASVLSLQGEIAQAIAREIRVTLSREEETLLAANREVNPEAYEAYLKGKSHFYRVTPGDLEISLQYFETALEKDPNYAPAYSGIALVWIGRRQMGITLPGEANPKIREAIQNALELDSEDVEAHHALAVDETWGAWNWEAAEDAFKTVIELNPSYAEVRAYYSHFLMIMKRQDEAMAEMELALQLDPLNELLQWLNIVVIMGARKFDEAIALSEEVLTTIPNSPHAWARLVEAYYASGRLEDCYKAAVANWTARARPDAVEALERGYQDGGFSGAMLRLAQWKDEVQGPGTGSVFNWAAAGEKQKALDYLERAFEIPDPNLPYMGLVVVYRDLHQEPRFQEMLARLNFPDEVLAKYLSEYSEGL
ncbi:MAG: protein kinase [Acidobacteriota bacterium]|nr:MAG: protein kinase [Acidobacteriota bacterium]